MKITDCPSDRGFSGEYSLQGRLNKRSLDPLEIRDDVKMRKVLVFVKILIDGRTASDRAGYTKSGRRCHKRTLRQFQGKRWRAHYIPLPDQQRHT